MHIYIYKNNTFHKYLFFLFRHWPKTLYGETIEQSDLHSLFAFPFHKHISHSHFSFLCFILVAAFDTIFLLELKVLQAATYLTLPWFSESIQCPSIFHKGSSLLITKEGLGQHE